MGARADEVLPYYTEREWREWDGSWELIEGEPYAMAPTPYLKHQEISLNIATFFKNKLKNCPMRCKTLLPVDWYVDETTIVQPDVLIVCGENIGSKKLTTTPTLIVEVLSFSTASRDRKEKFNLYQRSGVQYYLIIDPTAKKVEVYLNENGVYRLLGNFSEGIAPLNIFGCVIDLEIESVFEGIEE
jgi:Uma2 family endonuclease